MRGPGLRCRASDTATGVDLSRPGSGAELTARIWERGHRVDLVVNNAGVGSHGLIGDQSPDDIAAQIQLNCGSLADLTARFLPDLLKAKRGPIVNVASTAAFQVPP